MPPPSHHHRPITRLLLSPCCAPGWNTQLGRQERTPPHLKSAGTTQRRFRGKVDCRSWVEERGDKRCLSQQAQTSCSCDAYLQGKGPSPRHRGQQRAQGCMKKHEGAKEGKREHSAASHPGDSRKVRARGPWPRF